MEPDESGNIVPDSHPNETVLLVLSDLARLYGPGDPDSGRSTQRRGDMASGRKLGFYAARVVCTPSVTFRVLADEVLARSKSMVLESGGREEPVSLFNPSVHRRISPVQSRSVIEEL